MVERIIAHYEVLDEIGAGGMGVVYRARDTRLDREAAIKALPDELAEDSERLARFEREAKLLAALKNPYIATVYGLEEVDGRRFLAMELVDGESLAERLSKGPIPIRKALELARQIAAALEAAHKANVIHRDIKPGNIMIDNEGKARVLDFGLAKTLTTEGPEIDLSLSPTLSQPLTQVGQTLGTPVYMSPEQMEGKEADRQSDIWAFGCVLYEMLTGHRLFDEASVSQTMVAVLRADIDWERLPSETPRALRRLLRRCLEREPARRIHAAADARIELEDLVEGPSESAQGAAAAPSGPRTRPMSRVAWAAVGVALLFGVALGRFINQRETTESGTVRAIVLPPEGGAFELHPNLAGSVAVSPDGTRLVYSARAETGPTRLWVRRIDSLRAQPLEGTEGAAHPFWSPDGRFIAFTADAQLKKVAATGGPTTFLADLEPSRSLLGAGGGNGAGSWNREGVILFTPGEVAGTEAINRIPAEGGQPVPVTEVDVRAGETRHRHPRFLPDGNRFLYVATVAERLPPKHRLMLGSLTGGEPRELMETDSYAEVVAGHLWFVRDGVLMAQRFDPDSAAPIGEAQPVGEGAVSMVWARWNALGYFSVSAGGVMAFHTGAPIRRSVLTWYDQSGNTLGTVGPTDYQYQLSLSSGGSQAVLQTPDTERGLWSLWITDLPRGSRTRFTHKTTATGVWSPDDRRMAYQAQEIYIQPLGFEEAERLDRARLEADGTENTKLTWPLSWSRDGRFLVYASTLGGTDLWGLALGESGEPFPIQHSEFIEEDAALSPGGNWLAYTSDRSGRFEIYLTAFPQGGRSWQISAEGGLRPEWGTDTELYFLDFDDTLMTTTIEGKGDDVSIGEIQPLFRLEIRHHLLFEPGGYAMAPDGERILVNRVLSGGTQDPIALIVGWPEGLEVD